MSAYDELAAALDLPARQVPSLAKADAETLSTVAAAVQRLAEAEDAAVAKGMADAVRIIPFPLRKIARNVMFGDD